MAKLKSLRLSGWKSIKNAEIEFGDINILIGANGSGKSNLLSFFKMLNEMLKEQLQRYVSQSGGGNSLLHYGAKQTPQIEAELHMEADQKEFGYSVELNHAEPDRLIIAEEKLGQWPSGSTQRWVDTRNGGHEESSLRVNLKQESSAIINWIRLLLSSCRIYHFHDTSSKAHIRLTAQVVDNAHLHSDSGNLAAVLYRIMNDDELSYRRIVNTIRQIYPPFGDFVLQPDGKHATSIILKWQDRGQELVFGPHQISDGTLRAMALITLLLQPEHSLPEVILIDEPELDLHPYALEVIASLIRMVSHHKQVIISTQSVELLNHFGVEDIIVVDRREEATEFKRLKEEELRDWLEDYSIAELWEKNVIGGGPH